VMARMMTEAGQDGLYAAETGRALGVGVDAIRYEFADWVRDRWVLRYQYASGTAACWRPVKTDGLVEYASARDRAVDEAMAARQRKGAETRAAKKAAQAKAQAQPVEAAKGPKKAPVEVVSPWSRIRDGWLRTIGADLRPLIAAHLRGCLTVEDALALVWPEEWGDIGGRLRRYVEAQGVVEAQRAARARIEAMRHRPSEGWGVGWAEGGLLPREPSPPTVPRASVAKRATWGDR
jgi:hypothetical protein